MARPTKYNQTILEKTNEYLTAWKEQGDMIPSVEGLSEFINIARSTIYEWTNDEDKAEFSDMLEELQSLQAKTLINNGLSGEFNAAITKLVLTKHNYSDKQDTSLTGKDGEKLEVNLVAVQYE